ncbi:helix-turn-helix domain-containing protein [uncultured Croceitalea sp.]|uniref:helix-turn-helix domain-containing protein n=1 Tax=uncultured Croceitalea sp. TaxID=1798908 RepID=UPI00330578B0
MGQGEDYPIILVLSLFILMISYFAFNYSNVFNGKKISTIIPFVKYKKTGLSKIVSQEFKEKLEKLMLEEKPFLDVEIRLDNIAEALGINRHQTSQIINEHFNSSFYDFINAYRVKESKRILKDQKNKINISEVAFLSGFNNKVSFNIAFKKTTNMTPSEYRKLVISEHLVSKKC